MAPPVRVRFQAEGESGPALRDKRPDPRVRCGPHAGPEEAAAMAGVRIVNESKTDPIMMLKHFGPTNPDLRIP